jgi:hypothetical protein
LHAPTDTVLDSLPISNREMKKDDEALAWINKVHEHAACSIPENLNDTRNSDVVDVDQIVGFESDNRLTSSSTKVVKKKS